MAPSAPPETEPPVDRTEAWPREVLLGAPAMVYGRRVFRRLPSDPRCKLCAAPFRGPFTPVMRLIGKSPWAKNPKY